MAYNSCGTTLYTQISNNLKRILWVSKYTQNRITYILANTAFFIEDLVAAHNLVLTLQSTRFPEDRR
jgi:hypothetical protein